MNALLVFLGAGAGGLARYGVNIISASATLRLNGFPIGTLGINLLGCIVMGLVTAFFTLRSGYPASIRLMLTTGVLGGFTTFSAFSLEAAVLLEREQWGLALTYIAASVLLCLIGVAAGLKAGRWLF